LQRRLDALIADFTREILEAIGRTNLAEIVPARTAAKLKMVTAPKSRAKAAPRPPKKARRPARTQPVRVQRAESARVQRAAAPVRVERAEPVAEVALDPRTLEKMLLGAMRGAAPMNREDVLDSAAIGGVNLESARKVLDGLVERGIVGTANLSGAPLLFIKPSQPRRRVAKEKPSPAVAAASPVEAEPWKPTVIRRKKASADETAPANDATSEG
jgi:hypothetical protein